MTSKLEQDIFTLMRGNDLRKALQDAHEQGWAVAPPHEPLMEVFNKALSKPGCNLISVCREIIRAHVLAFRLEGKALESSNKYFTGMIWRDFL